MWEAALDKSLLIEQSPGAHHIHSPKGFNFHTKEREGKEDGKWSVLSLQSIQEHRGEKSPSTFFLTPMQCCLFLTHQKISPQSKERGAKQLYKL